jgi:hypothetical protein
VIQFVNPTKDEPCLTFFLTGPTGLDSASRMAMMLPSGP